MQESLSKTPAHVKSISVKQKKPLDISREYGQYEKRYE